MIGIHIQAPWASMLVDGIKCVETRTYPLPNRLEGEILAVIETPGKSKNFKSRIIGTIVFSHSFEYKNENEWIFDYNRHLIKQSDNNYGWNSKKQKYGWIVSFVSKLEKYVAPPSKRGIIYAKECLLI